MTQEDYDPLPEAEAGLYICMFSIHGLIRGHDLELGRDADTGGQTRYVVELARALGELPEVARVELVTRRVVDGAVSQDYAQREESLGGRATILRMDAGPEAYLPKEQLWDCMDELVDNMVSYLRAQPRMPDLLHSHYADAGYVASRLSHLLGIPLIHTGHSLGRVKRRRLIAAGLSADEVERRYHITRRIHAEELTLATCERVIASTSQEVTEQYGLYDFYHAERMEVIPPGTDLDAFHPADGSEGETEVAAELTRWLREPNKPMVLCLARPVARKNLSAHVEAFARDKRLREVANLVVVAGQRDDIEELDEASRAVLSELLMLIDRHDLYGSVALPKHVSGDQIATLYRLAATTRGVHVNAALTEPFGLTLIEAAACGLPIVATSDGGPRDIIENCGNGVLVDPLDPDDIAAGIADILLSPGRWDQLAQAGLTGVRTHYAWRAHAKRYLEVVDEVVSKRVMPLAPRPQAKPNPITYHDRAIATDLDNNLLAHPRDLPLLIDALRKHARSTAFVIATGRSRDAALSALRQHGLPDPDVLICSGGTRIFYRPELSEDEQWVRHIDKQWTPQLVRRVLDALPGLERQPRSEQSAHKISYFVDPNLAPSQEEINAILFREDQAVNAVISFGRFLDVFPIRASKGLALRYAMSQLGIDAERVLAAGGCGADEDMLRGNTLAVVLRDRHTEELAKLAEVNRIYFAEQPGPRGILEAAEHYDLFDRCERPGRLYA